MCMYVLIGAICVQDKRWQLVGTGSEILIKFVHQKILNEWYVSPLSLFGYRWILLLLCDDSLDEAAAGSADPLSFRFQLAERCRASWLCVSWGNTCCKTPLDTCRSTFPDWRFRPQYAASWWLPTEKFLNWFFALLGKIKVKIRTIHKEMLRVNDSIKDDNLNMLACTGWDLFLYSRRFSFLYWTNSGRYNHSIVVINSTCNTNRRERGGGGKL